MTNSCRARLFEQCRRRHVNRSIRRDSAGMPSYHARHPSSLIVIFINRDSGFYRFMKLSNRQVLKSASYHCRKLSVLREHKSVRLCHPIIEYLLADYMFATIMTIGENRFLPSVKYLAIRLQLIGDRLGLLKTDGWPMSGKRVRRV